MYGHYKEDLAEFARSHAAKLSRLNKRDERRSRLPGGKLFVPQLTGNRFRKVEEREKEQRT